MTETRKGGALKQAKVRTRAAAATASAPQAASPANVADRVVSVAPKASGKKSKAKIAVAPQPQPMEEPPVASPSPGKKKKKRKRIHKKKGSGNALLEEPQSAEESTPPPKKKGNGKQVAKAVKAPSQVAKASRPPARAQEAASVKKSNKRKKRSDSIDALVDGAVVKADGRWVTETPKKKKRKPTKKQTVEEQTPKGRTTRAALAAATADDDAADTATGVVPDESPAVTASKSKKKSRKAKLARTSSMVTEPAKNPEPAPVEQPSERKSSEQPVLRKSARLSNEEPVEVTIPDPSLARPVRKIISFAKVKGTKLKIPTLTKEEGPTEHDKKDGGEDSLVETVSSHSSPTFPEAPVDELEQTMKVPAGGEQHTMSDVSNAGRATDVSGHEAEIDSDSADELEEPADKSIEHLSGGNQEENNEQMMEVGASTDASIRREMTQGLENITPQEMVWKASQETSIPQELVENASLEESTPLEMATGLTRGELNREESTDGTHDVLLQVDDIAEGDKLSGSVPLAAVGDSQETEVGMEEDDLSEGSIAGSEVFSLKEINQEDDVEYRSLGVDNLAEAHEREKVVELYEDDEHEDDDEMQAEESKEEETGSASSTGALLSFDVALEQRETLLDDEKDYDREESVIGDRVDELNTSFVEEEGDQDEEYDIGDLTDSDVDDDEAEAPLGRPDAAMFNTLSGAEIPHSNSAVEAEIIELSDTESDESEDSDATANAAHQQTFEDNGVNEDEEHEEDEEDDAGLLTLNASQHDDPESEVEIQALHVPVPAVGTSELDALQAGAVPHISTLQSDNEFVERDYSSPEELDGTEEMSDGEHEVSHAPGDKVVEDRNVQSDTDVEGEELDGHDAPTIQRTLFSTETHLPPASVPEARMFPQERQAPSDLPGQVVTVNAPLDSPSQTTPVLQVDKPTTAQVGRTARASAETDYGPEYLTTPSKLLIDSVLSASREVTLANISQSAIATTPVQQRQRASYHPWGPSFGVTESPDTSVTTENVPNQAVASPLSSWFFSRGPANFKKRVQIPSPESPRQRLGSPRPMKVARLDNMASAKDHTSRFDPESTGSERFVQDLLGKSSWRSWYRKTSPDELLDPPLPAAMLKRLGGDGALAMFAQAASVPQALGHPSEVVIVPRKRKLALAQLEASIQEEKKRAKAFDAELLQLLQGKTLSGRELTDEFAPLLPSVTQ